jgi:hypothetical protein
MSNILAVTGEISLRSQDWTVAAIALIVVYLVLYPSYVLVTRRKHTRRISGQLVTKSYKLPQQLSPTELAYLFSTKVNRSQLYATLLDLSNRSILTMKKKNSKTHTGIGPKVETSLKEYERVLVRTIEQADEDIAITRVIDGPGQYELPSGELINGSKQYVFWWLLRDTMRKNNIIKTDMLRQYSSMILSLGLLGSFAIVLASTLGASIFSMLENGELLVGEFAWSIGRGFIIWILVALPCIIVSFFLLRFRGRMLGRYWLLTPKYERYIEQFEAYREFVRLTHRGKLHFDSKLLEKESIAQTRPYAIAFGYAKD